MKMGFKLPALLENSFSNASRVFFPNPSRSRSAFAAAAEPKPKDPRREGFWYERGEPDTDTMAGGGVPAREGGEVVDSGVLIPKGVSAPNAVSAPPPNAYLFSSGARWPSKSKKDEAELEWWPEGAASPALEVLDWDNGGA